jgi:hypothetical protein
MEAIPLFITQQTTIIHLELKVPDNSSGAKFTSTKRCCVTLNRRALFTYHLYLMYSGIIKIYYRKTVGHVFTKPVQREGTIEKIFSQYVVFHRSSHFCR